jgi:molecular chaperone GrpE
MKGDRKKRPVHIPVTKGGKKQKAAKSTPREKDKAPEPMPAVEKPLEYDELLETLLRLKAEYTNYQNRTERERQEWRETCVRDVFLKTLPVLDNLERALAAAEEHRDNEQLRSGVERILQQFYQLLATEKIEPIESVGKKFDPRYHDAVMMEETDEVAPQTIVSEVLRGYMIGEKVLRPARVTVSRTPLEKQNDTSPGSGQEE